MKQKLGAKIFAIFALFGIIVGIVGTGALFLISSQQSYQVETPEMTQEEIQQLIEEAGLDTTNSGETSGIEDNSIVEVVPSIEEVSQESESGTLND